MKVFKRIYVVGFLLTFSLAVSMVAPVAAQDSSDIKKEIEKLNQEKKKLEEKEESVTGDVSEKQKTVEELTQELKKIELEVNGVEVKISSEQVKLDSAIRENQEIELLIEQKQQQIEEVEAKIVDQAIAGYIRPPNPQFESADFSTNLRMQVFLESLTGQEFESVEELQRLTLDLATEKAIAETLQSDIEEGQVILEKEKSGLEKIKKSQVSLVQEAELSLEAKLSEAAVLAERDKELSKDIQDKTQELARRTAVAQKKNPAPINSGNARFPSSSDIVQVQGIWVHVSIEDSFRRLMNAAASDGITLGGWGYRDNANQIRLRKKHCGTSNYAVYQMSSSRCSPPTARPGFSQHEQGLAIDFTYNGGSMGTRSNKGYKWLAANAHKYGFKNLPSEPWHWSTTGR